MHDYQRFVDRPNSLILEIAAGCALSVPRASSMRHITDEQNVVRSSSSQTDDGSLVYKF